MGDPASISSEITVLAWKNRHRYALSPFFVLSPSVLLERLRGRHGFDIPLRNISTPHEAVELFDQALPVLNISGDAETGFGVPNAANGSITINSISKAVELVQTGQASSLVTNPINKHVLYEAGFDFPGHTEYLANLASAAGKPKLRPVMMLVSDQLRTVPLTIHIPLSQVEPHITPDLIKDTVRIVANDLTRCFGLKAPRITLAGLNPHAGENGAMGRIEIDLIEPAVQTLQEEGICVSGPFPADTLFHAKARKTYDVVIGMYHDQALIPIKTLDFDKGVNTTLGLPFVRTSPDHGTAYNIAGKGIADPRSLVEALKLAREMSDHAMGRT